MDDKISSATEHTAERLRHDCCAMRALVGELSILAQATRVALMSGNEAMLKCRLDELEDWLKRHSIAFCKLIDSIQLVYYIEYLLGDDESSGDAE